MSATVTAAAEKAAVSPLDVVRLTIAAEQTAGSYYGKRGALTFTRSDAVRYTSESWLNRRPTGGTAYTLAQVWDVVAAIVDASPELLTLTDEERAERAKARAAQVAAHELDAAAAYKDGRHADAHAAIDAGELADPDHTTYGRLHSWAELRGFVDKRDAAQAEPAAVAALAPVGVAALTDAALAEELRDMLEQVPDLTARAAQAQEKLRGQTRRTSTHYGDDRTGWPASSAHAVRDLETAVSDRTLSLAQARAYRGELEAEAARRSAVGAEVPALALLNGAAGIAQD